MGALSKDELKGKSFIFAGKVYDDIRDEFYQKYRNLQDKVQILCFDEFCEYSFLGSLCLSSNFILLPYSNTSQSSGVIGYASQFQIPVVVAKQGLLGKLVKRYKLGVLLEDASSFSIKNFLINGHNYRQEISVNYYKERTKMLFNSIIFEQFNV